MSTIQSQVYTWEISITVFNILAKQQLRKYTKIDYFVIQPVRGSQIQFKGLPFPLTVFSAIYMQAKNSYDVCMLEEDSDQSLGSVESTPAILRMLRNAQFVCVDRKPRKRPLRLPASNGKSEHSTHVLVTV
jgi:hypothetical protein